MVKISPCGLFLMPPSLLTFPPPFLISPHSLTLKKKKKSGQPLRFMSGVEEKKKN